MPLPEKCTEEEFITLYRKLGATKLASHFGVGLRNVHRRRRYLELKYHISLSPPEPRRRHQTSEHSHRVALTVQNGTVLVGSDAHYWPGPTTPAHRAFLKFLKEFKPAAVIANGDMTDFARISRHPPIGHDKSPQVEEELEAAKERMHEIAVAAGRARKIWPLGNHDGRFETRLATVAPEYAKIHGHSLNDHFPLWEPCWAVWINDSVVIKHRWKGGVHGAHNNTINAGKTMVTGHDHALRVSPFSDYNGTRWGVSTGTLADPYGRQFLDYTEDNPRNHRAGFVVLTFRSGRLLWPELVAVVDDNHVDFRGELIAI